MISQRLIVSITKEEEVCVSDDHILKAAMGIIRQRAGFDHDWFLKNGMIMQSSLMVHGIGWPEVKVRDASESDKTVFGVLKFLQDLNNSEPSK